MRLQRDGCRRRRLELMCVGRVFLPAAVRTAARTTASAVVASASIGCVGIQTVSGLAGAECDDPANRIVRRDADGHSISGNHLNSKTAHSAAQLRQDFVAGITLHAVQPAAVNRNHRSLHVNQIILAQLLAFLSFKQTLCHKGSWGLRDWVSGELSYRERTASSTSFASVS